MATPVLQSAFLRRSSAVAGRGCELVASAKVRFHSRLCIIGRLGQKRTSYSSTTRRRTPVAVQLTLLARGDSGELSAYEVILMPSGV